MKLQVAFFLSLVALYLKMHYGIFVHPFIPFLVLLIKRPLASILWISFGCGLFIDLLSSSPFGIICLQYTLTAFLLTFFQKYFDEKRVQTFFLMNLFACLIFSLLSLITINFTEKEFSLTISSLLAELLVYCPLGAVFGVVFLYYPLFFIEKLKKVSFKRIFKRRKKIRG